MTVAYDLIAPSTLPTMDRSIVISLLIGLTVLAVVAITSRRFLKRVRTSSAERTVRPARLTSEHLHRLPPPTWRLVLEIDHPGVPDVDQVVVGPCGVLAISTELGDRPALDHAVEDTPGGARATAAAAIIRATVDDLVSTAGSRCQQLVHVYWGAPDLDRPAALPVVHATVAVEGHRLDEWITSLPADVLTPAQVDLIWSAITTGIGRLDPLRS